MSEVSKRGRTAVVICSTPFVELARSQARVFKTPDLPLVVVSHPLGGISEEAVALRVQEALPQLMDIISRRLS